MRCGVKNKWQDCQQLNLTVWRLETQLDKVLQTLTDINTTYTHICTHDSKHCLHIHIYECIMLNLLLFGIFVWKYAECIPGNDTTPPPHINSAHLLFLMRLLHLMAISDYFSRHDNAFCLSAFLSPSPAPTTLNIDSSSSERDLSYYGVTFPFSSLKSDPSTSHCYDRN